MASTFSFTKSANGGIVCAYTGTDSVPLKRTVMRGDIQDIRISGTTLVIDLRFTAVEGDYKIKVTTDDVTIGTDVYTHPINIDTLKTAFDTNAVFQLANSGSGSSAWEDITGKPTIPDVPEVAATKSAVSVSTAKRLVYVTADETNNGDTSLYFHNGTTLKFLQTITVFILCLFGMVNAQTPQTSYVVTSISAMKSYFGAANKIYVAATNEDYVICSGCTADEAIVYAGAGGRKWQKVSDATKVGLSKYLTDSAKFKLNADSVGITGYTSRGWHKKGLDSIGTSKVGNSDTAAMLAAYKAGMIANTAGLTGKTNNSDTAVMLSNYRTGMIANTSAIAGLGSTYAALSGATFTGAMNGVDVNITGTFAGSNVISSTIRGGQGTTSTLTIKPTSGVGTTGSDIIFGVGNNGATQALRLYSNGDASFLSDYIKVVNGSNVQIGSWSFGGSNFFESLTGGATSKITTSAIIGGITTTSSLTIKPTSNVGTTGADIIFGVGSNGATEAMRILNNGNTKVSNTMQFGSNSGVYVTSDAFSLYVAAQTNQYFGINTANKAVLNQYGLSINNGSTGTSSSYNLLVNGTSQISTSLETPALNGTTSANGTLTFNSTTNATKTSGGIIMQPSGGNVIVGASSGTHTLDITSTTPNPVWINTNQVSGGFTMNNTYNGNGLGSYTGMTIAFNNTEKWFVGSDGPNSTADLIFRSLGSVNPVRFYASSAVENTLVVKAGNVGFGITSPTAIADLKASTTSAAHLHLTAGVAPTTPNNGDIWFDGTDLKIRVSGTTYTLTKQ